MIRLTIGALAAALALSPAASAQQDFYDEGNRLYQAGDYTGALGWYERIVEAGFESSALYYNMGNAHFKLGALGPSVLYYERALRLDPGDPDVRANLELARSLAADEITPLPGFWVARVFEAWVTAIPRSLLRLIVGLGYVGTGAAVIVWVLGNTATLRRWGARTAVAAGGLVAVFGSSLFVVELGFLTPTEAVVMHPEVSVHSAPSDERSLEVFRIHEGTKVRIDEQSGDWAEIVLADGQVGWVDVEAIEEI